MFFFKNTLVIATHFISQLVPYIRSLLYLSCKFKVMYIYFFFVVNNNWDCPWQTRVCNLCGVDNFVSYHFSSMKFSDSINVHLLFWCCFSILWLLYGFIVVVQLHPYRNLHPEWSRVKIIFDWRNAFHWFKDESVGWDNFFKF